MKIQKNHWGIIFDPKMMILQGFRRPKPCVAVCYANDPKKRGDTTPAPVLDLTTSLRGDLARSFKGWGVQGGGGGWDPPHTPQPPVGAELLKGAWGGGGVLKGDGAA